MNQQPELFLSDYELAPHDLRLVVATCTRAEQNLYEDLVKVSLSFPEPDFVLHRLLVANIKLLNRERHGGFKRKLTALIQKQLIVALNPPFSHQQRYLIGCEWEGSRFFASWIRDCLAWRLPQTELPPVSKGAQRPQRPETPISLQTKGFSPRKPSELSLNSNPNKTGAQSPDNGARSPRAPVARAPVRKTSLYAQRVALAQVIANLAGTPVISTGKEGVILTGLIKTFGFEAARALVQQAWSKRSVVLTDQFPTFTAQSVWFYARYKHKDNRSVTDPPPAISLQQLISDSLDNEGNIDHEQLHRRARLYRLQRSPSHDAICSEFGIDPQRLFSS